MVFLKQASVCALIVLAGASAASAQGRVSDMLSNCQFEAASRLGGDVANTTVKYEGQRTDGTHAVNGTIFVQGRTANFQCSFAADRVTIVDFWTDASQAQLPLRPPQSGGGIPFFNATCGNGVELHADQGGPIYINGNESSLKKFNDNYYEASYGDATISLSINPDGSPNLSASWRGGGNGVCNLVQY